MVIGLKTDFTDWYDLQFRKDEGDLILERYQVGGMTRREILAYLGSLGYKTPLHGVVADIVPTLLETTKRNMGMLDEELIDLSTDVDAAKKNPKQEIDLAVREVRQKMYEDSTKFVVYTDETLHRGEGKVLVSGEEALSKYPKHYASHYIQSLIGGGAFSRRVLSIGEIGFILEYHSTDDWRSNCGETAVAVTHKFVAPRDNKIPYPMWAIDFIQSGTEQIAIDFNTAPGLDAVKDYVSATEIYDAVEKFMVSQKK